MKQLLFQSFRHDEQIFSCSAIGYSCQVICDVIQVSAAAMATTHLGSTSHACDTSHTSKRIYS